MKIEIEWLSDDSDCETCGCNWAQGANVYIDGEKVISLEPVAHCYGGVSYDESEVYKAIFEYLGHTVESK